MNNIRWEDLVFTNRNQSYGAYVLRKAYPGRVTVSFAFAMTVVTMILASPLISKLLGTDVPIVRTIPNEGGFIEPQPEPIIERIPQPKLTVPVQQIRFVPPRVTPEEIEDVTPTIEELQVSNVSDQNVESAIFTDDV